MWYCQKCIKWHHDSVSILKHLQTCNVTDRPPSNDGEGKRGCDSKVQNEKAQNPKPGTLKCLTRKKKKLPEINILNRMDKPKSILRGNQSSIISLVNNEKSLNPPVLSVKKVNNAANEFMVIGNSKTPGLVSKISRAYVCKFCCLKFQIKDQLDAHLKTHEGNARHACHQCGFITGTFSALMSHYVKHSSIKTPTDYKFCENKNVISSHQAEKKKGMQDRVLNSFNCKKCKKQFDTKKSFHTHYCPPEDKKTEYICAYCRQVTTTVEEYRDHIQSHTPPLIYTCENCPRKFGYKFQLNKHMQVCLKKTAEVASKRKRKPASSPTKTKKLKANKSKQKTQRTTDPLLGKTNTSMKTTDLEANVEKQYNEIVDSNTNYHSIVEKDNQRIPIISVKIKQEKEDADIHSRLRPKKSKVVYASESSPEDNGNLQPTRRSARLVTRKHIRFSRTSSDSESAEIDKIQEEESALAAITETLISAPTILLSPKETVEAPNTDESVKPAKKSLSPKRSPIVTSPKKRIMFSLGKKAKHKRLKQDGNIEIKSGVLWCNLCSLHFRSIGSLKRHRKMHSGKPQFVCQFCGKFFYRRDIHRRHEGNVHQNKSSGPYHCYYCKKGFEISSQLNEHVLSSHSGKALHPERIRRCTPSADSQSPVNIKKEPTVVPPLVPCEADTSLKSESIPEFVYKCGICETTFDTTSYILKHFEETHAMCENLNIVKVLKSNVIPALSSNTKFKKNMQRRPSKTQREIKPLPKAPEVTSADSAVSNLKFSWNNTENSCVLCFSKLPETGTRMCCEVDIHKAIDWYECPLCFETGHKLQMREHMLKHLKKIGTYIINVNDKKFAEVSQSVRLKKEQVIKSNVDATDGERLDEIISSIHTLIQEVDCTRCSEKIVDSKLLLTHPCLQLDDGTFSCCATNCDITSDSLFDIQNHLKNFHCIGIMEEAQHRVPALSCDMNEVADNVSMQISQLPIVHTYANE